MKIDALAFVSILALLAIFVTGDDADISGIKMVPDDESLIPEVNAGEKKDQSSTESPAVSYSFSIPEAEVRSAFDRS